MSDFDGELEGLRTSSAISSSSLILSTEPLPAHIQAALDEGFTKAHSGGSGDLHVFVDRIDRAAGLYGKRIIAYLADLATREQSSPVSRDVLKAAMEKIHQPADPCGPSTPTRFAALGLP